MAKITTTNNLGKGVALFSGYVDNVRHVGDDDFGRSGDWLDVAIFGGIVTIPLLDVVSVDDQIIVQGFLRNRGRVIDLVPQSILICKTDEDLAQWDNAFNASYRAKLRCTLSAYGRESRLAHKTTQKFASVWQGFGIQFSSSLDQEQYLAFKPFDNELVDWHFDLVRSFASRADEFGNKSSYDTWRLENPRLITKTRRPAATPANGSPSDAAK